MEGRQTDGMGRKTGKRTIVTLGGMPGSGKSTVRSALSATLGYTAFSTGDYSRSLAKERGMTLEAFNEEVAKDKSLDLLIDAKLEAIERDGHNIIVDSILGYHFIPSAFHVYLDISPEESARRIFNDRDAVLRRESGELTDTLEETRARIERRMENHRRRYLNHYGLDPYDTRHYDLVANTEIYDCDAVVEIIAKAYDAWLKS